MKDLNQQFKEFMDKPGFPSKWQEKDLEEFLNVTCELSKTAGGMFLQRVDVYIQIATNELAARSSKRISRSLIAISIAAIIISLWTGYSSNIRSKNWEDNQLEVLERIEESLRQLNL